MFDEKEIETIGKKYLLGELVPPLVSASLSYKLFEYQSFYLALMYWKSDRQVYQRSCKLCNNSSGMQCSIRMFLIVPNVLVSLRILKYSLLVPCGSELYGARVSFY